VFIGSPRPSFNNIGNQIDLGPKKFFDGNSVFVTSTQSNKIFIGSPDSKEEEQSQEITAPGNKRQFPSFPSRGKLGALSFPFRPKSFGAAPTTTDASSSTSTQQDVSAEDENDSFEVTPFTTANPTPTTTTQFEPTSSRFSSPFSDKFAKSKRRFNSFFNRKRPGQTEVTSTSTSTTTQNTFFNRKRFEQSNTADDESIENVGEPEAFTTQTADTPFTSFATTATTATTTTTNNNAPQQKRRFPFNVRKNLLGLKARGRGRTDLVRDQTSAKTIDSVEEKIVSEENKSAEEVDVTTLPATASVNGLFDDSEEANEISEESKERNRFRVNRPSIKKQKNGFKRFGGVKKARTPPNANIRVEFKKDNIPEESEEEVAPKKFFVRPDGRKPRVKSNIRARIANKGQNYFQDSGEVTVPESTGVSGFRHSTKVDDANISGESTGTGSFEDQEDNLEKRHISSAELNSYNQEQYQTTSQVYGQPRQYEQESFQRQPTHSVFYPAEQFNSNTNKLPRTQNQHIIYEPTVSSAEQQDQQNSQEDNLVPVPFLTLNPRPTRQQELLEQLVVESGSSSTTSGSSSGAISSGSYSHSSRFSSPSGAIAPAFRSSLPSTGAVATAQSTSPVQGFSSVASTGKALAKLL
jgi:hypothetical protein